jgi:branched-subunit amino acid transport protein
MTLWLTIAAAGVLTYVTRLSFIYLLDRVSMPDWFRRALRFVPAAVLSAIVLPELLIPNGTVLLPWKNPALLSGIVAVLVAWRAKNVPLTIIVGMAALLVLRAVL